MVGSDGKLAKVAGSNPTLRSVTRAEAAALWCGHAVGYLINSWAFIKQLLRILFTRFLCAFYTLVTHFGRFVEMPEITPSLAGAAYVYNRDTRCRGTRARRPWRAHPRCGR